MTISTTAVTSVPSIRAAHGGPFCWRETAFGVDARRDFVAVRTVGERLALVMCRGVGAATMTAEGVRAAASLGAPLLSYLLHEFPDTLDERRARESFEEFCRRRAEATEAHPADACSVVGVRIDMADPRFPQGRVVVLWCGPDRVRAVCDGAVENESGPGQWSSGQGLQGTWGARLQPLRADGAPASVAVWSETLKVLDEVRDPLPAPALRSLMEGAARHVEGGGLCIEVQVGGATTGFLDGLPLSDASAAARWAVEPQRSPFRMAARMLGQLRAKSSRAAGLAFAVGALVGVGVVLGLHGRSDPMPPSSPVVAVRTPLRTDVEAVAVVRPVTPELHPASSAPWFTASTHSVNVWSLAQVPAATSTPSPTHHAAPIRKQVAASPRPAKPDVVDADEPIVDSPGLLPPPPVEWVPGNGPSPPQETPAAPRRAAEAQTEGAHRTTVQRSAVAGRGPSLRTRTADSYPVRGVPASRAHAPVIIDVHANMPVDDGSVDVDFHPPADQPSEVDPARAPH